MLDLLLIGSLGFLGSFGHCAGMCGPIATAFALSAQSTTSRWQSVRFHLLLNVGRILSYVLIGAGIGALGSVLIAGGQMAGLGSVLRRSMAVITGLLLIWFGLTQIRPGWLPPIPLLHPILQGKLHDRLSRGMLGLSADRRWWTPLALGMVWGLIPCGFLYAAQIKAAETGSGWFGAATMLAFGLGTIPTMFGVGVSAALLNADRRGQLFRLAGWITLTIGILTLMRTGSMMVDATGYASLLCLMLALVARPISRIWAGPLRYRRALGVGAFVLALAHTLHMIDHSWKWNFQAIGFMLPQHRWGMILGGVALALMLPAVLTSFDRAQKWLGAQWRWLHLLAVPALLAATLHCILVGSRFLGTWQISTWNWLAVSLLLIATTGVLAVRTRWIWSLLGLGKLYQTIQRQR
jgi:uncharacterized protein